ncbi:MAG: CehA/McbA family metallohydrolase [Myxococcota bacterium]
MGHAMRPAPLARSAVSAAAVQAALALGSLAAFAALASAAPARADDVAEPRRAEGGLFAERLTAETVSRLAIGGPDADAGVGDWVLGNGTICAAISDPAHESPLSPRGGVLVDLGHCGHADDQWAVLHPIANLSQSEILPIDSIAAGRDAEHAFIETRAVFRGVEIRTTYTVDLAQPTALAVAMRARRFAPDERVFALGAIALHASGQLAAFSLSRDGSDHSYGFAHPASDRSSTRGLLASITGADLTVLVGGDGLPPISYGVERVGAARTDGAEVDAVAAFTITGGHYTLMNALASPPWIGRAAGAPGLFHLARIPFMDLELEAELALDFRIWVGERADVASVTDRLFAGGATVRGRIDDPEARIHFARVGGDPVSEVAPDADGRYALRLPPGRYRAEARGAADRLAVTELEVPVAAAGTDPIEVPELALGAPGWIALPDDFVGRVVFLRTDGSGPARFGDTRLGFRSGEQPIASGLEAEFVNVAGDGAPRRIPIPPGAYRAIATRGPEFAAHEGTIEVHPGKTAKLAFAPLPRVAPTPGWLAADLHVHSGRSFDSNLPEARQIEAFAASGAEVLVSTEHDRIFDPRETIAAAGLAGEIVGVTGSEMTSAWAGGESPFTAGHLNVFPLEREANAWGRGAIPLEGRRLRDVFAELRARPRPPFVQMNHPRPHPNGDDVDAYFNHLAVAGEALDPARPLGEWPNSVLIERSPEHGLRDLDVDAIELMNAEDMLRFRRTRADWLSFLLQGERIVGTANSDSHRLGEIVGLPRTYVRVDDDRVRSFDSQAFVEALRAGRAYGSTGPLLNARLGLAEIGEIHAGSKGVLEITVDAAEWVPIAEWRAYVDGELIHRAPIARGESAALPLAFERDAFVTVEVEGPAEGLYRDVLPGFVPFAFSNPIFVDVDGNGRYDAPGLPEILPKTITSPDEPD